MMALVVLNDNLEGLQTNRLIGSVFVLSDDALGETNGGLWLIRCREVGCLEQQPGRAVGESHYNLEGLQINYWPENIGLGAKCICSEGKTLGEDLLGLLDEDRACQWQSIGRGNWRLRPDEVWWYWLSEQQSGRDTEYRLEGPENISVGSDMDPFPAAKLVRG